MVLAKEQRRAAALLLGIALIGWIVYATWPSRQPLTPNPRTTKRPWSERKDSIRRADSLRFIQWKTEREARYDSFFVADSIRHAAWRIERQARWDSMRRADSLWRDSMGIYFTPRPKRDTILDLNHCDTAELQLIRGIGHYTAVQIIKYREQLGGFYSPEQLLEAPLSRPTGATLSKLSLDTLLHHFTASPQDVRRIPVNTASVEALQRHPYLRHSQAKAIYTLRRKQVRIGSIDELRALPDLTDSLLNKLAPYLSFE